MRSITTEGEPKQLPSLSIQNTLGAGTSVLASAFSTKNSRARSVFNSVPAASRMSIKGWVCEPVSSVQVASTDQFSRERPPALRTRLLSTMLCAEGMA